MPTSIVLQNRFGLTRDLEGAKNYFESKLSYIMSPYELNKRIRVEDSSIQVIDVRSGEEFQKMHIKSAISIPLNELEHNLDKLSRDKVHILYCSDQQCHLSAKAGLILVQNGYTAMELEGGLKAWNQKALPVEKGD